MRRKRAGALAALLLTAFLSSCEEAGKPEVTFRTVVTEGIVAHTVPMTTSERKTAQVFSDEPEEAAELVIKPEHTRHYETTIPEALVGGTETRETPPGTQTAESEETYAQTTAAPPETTLPVVTEEPADYAKTGENGILVVKRADGHYWGLMGCWGTYGLCESWAKGVNEFAKSLPDVTVYNTIIPTSSEFYVPAGFESFTASQKGKIDHVSGVLKNVVDVDSYSPLREHADEPVFARTDHHWQPLGAYYSAQAFAAAAEVDFPDISEYEKVSRGGYVGSMYGYSKDAHLYNDPEKFTLYIPPNNSALETTYYNTSFSGGYKSALIISPDGSGYYCSFLGSDDRIAKIETDCKNGRTLVIFKESYGNALAPFLTSSFETIYVCDIRYFTPNAVTFCKEVGATDLLFAVCTFTAAGTNGNHLKRILNN